MTPVRMTIDFTDARTTLCHSYVGVRARLNDDDEVLITIRPDGCEIGQSSETTVACDHPEIDMTQAEAVAMLLTGSEALQPRKGEWDKDRRCITYPLGKSRRIMML